MPGWRRVTPRVTVACLAERVMYAQSAAPVSDEGSPALRVSSGCDPRPALRSLRIHERALLGDRHGTNTNSPIRKEDLSLAHASPELSHRRSLGSSPVNSGSHCGPTHRRGRTQARALARPGAPFCVPAQFAAATETRCAHSTRRLVSAFRLTATQSAGDRVAAADGSLRHIAFRERSSSRRGLRSRRVWSETTCARFIDLRDLELHDILVLRDLVRFGVLANDQIDRRYGDAARASGQTATAGRRRPGRAWSPLIEDTAVYSATAAGARRRALRPARDPTVTRASAPRHRRRRPGRLHPGARAKCRLAHRARSSPRAPWRSAARAPTGDPNPTATSPTACCSTDGKCLAIELEHTDKGDLRYAEICRWFALTVRVDGIRWYVDDPKTMARIRRVNEQHGFAQDVDVTYAPFPPGVVGPPLGTAVSAK